MKKALSLILMLCMLLSMAPFSVIVSAESAVTITLEKDVYASGESIPYTVNGMDETAIIAAGAWAAIYPASVTTYTSGAYADWEYPQNSGYKFPSGDSS